MSEAKKTVPVRLQEEAIKSLDELVGSVYGSSRAEVARTLIINQLMRLSEKGVIKLHFASASAEDQNAQEET
ncbi:MAG: hypothetical protein APF80_01335 [Alphaproteobacteria bacterium BRH_c36]|nr:MAG: hypothetical protein APF80_01335 [Alphaproteobacteria bacterium BRH_c36]